ncbi:MAG: VanZ family protein [Muribaculaceae bacterium]|nr:VanZ family protein [Muribaculaceae bacterium]
MDKIRKELSRFPKWLFTILTGMLILWLTLMPDPLGDDAPKLFPGADKLVHGVMFGFLTFVILLDRQRTREWRKQSDRVIVIAALVSSLSGILIEVLQLLMDMGRGFEVADMAADTAGAFLCAWGWKILQSHWSR